MQRSRTAAGLPKLLREASLGAAHSKFIVVKSSHTTHDTLPHEIAQRVYRYAKHEHSAWGALPPVLPNPHHLRMVAPCCTHVRKRAHVHAEHALDVVAEDALKDAPRVRLRGLARAALEEAGVVLLTGLFLLCRLLIQIRDHVRPGEGARKKGSGPGQGKGHTVSWLQGGLSTAAWHTRESGAKCNPASIIAACSSTCANVMKPNCTLAWCHCRSML